MLRILGLYNNSGSPDKDFINEADELFKIKGNSTKYATFRHNNISLIYEMLNLQGAENFYFIDKNKQLACFIVGHIFAYEKGQLEILGSANIAREIADRYKKEGVDFAKYLRGIFNIILFDKNRLFLINDDLGLSPMYIHRRDKGFLFCSEAEPIIWLSPNSRVDFHSVTEFIKYGFAPDGKTFIKGLFNQPPGTIVSINGRALLVRQYFSFQIPDTAQMDEKQKIRMIKDAFNEAVRIRIPKEPVFSDLSGGWDTRFILANLLELNKKPAVFTRNSKGEELVIASEMAHKAKVKQIIYDSPQSSKRSDFHFKLGCQKSLFEIYQDDRPFMKSLKSQTDFKSFLSPRFTGLFGTEVLGCIPAEFRIKVGRDLGRFIKDMNIPSGYIIYLFLTQIGRSYLNTHNGPNWERPTCLFSYRSLCPFADSKFIALASSLEYNKYMYYNLYTQLFDEYYREFLQIPWTYTRYRRRNDLLEKNVPDKNMARYRNLCKRNDKSLSALLKMREKYSKSDQEISDRMRELYSLFMWLSTYRSRLNHADAEALDGMVSNMMRDFYALFLGLSASKPAHGQSEIQPIMP